MPNYDVAKQLHAKWFPQELRTNDRFSFENMLLDGPPAYASSGEKAQWYIISNLWRGIEFGRALSDLDRQASIDVVVALARYLGVEEQVHIQILKDRIERNRQRDQAAGMAARLQEDTNG